MSATRQSVGKRGPKKTSGCCGPAKRSRWFLGEFRSPPRPDRLLRRCQIDGDDFRVVSNVCGRVGVSRMAPDDFATERFAGRLENMEPAEFFVTFAIELGEDQVPDLAKQQVSIGIV